MEDGDQAHPVDVAQVGRRRVAHHDRCRHILTGDRVNRQHNEASETIGDIECSQRGQLDEHVFGVPDVPVDAEEGGVLEPIGGTLELLGVAEAGLEADAVAEAEGGVVVDVPTKGGAVELEVHD